MNHSRRCVINMDERRFPRRFEMGAPDESHEKENQGEPFWFPGPESMVEEMGSLSPEDEFFTLAQRPSMESGQICCESQILDEIWSAACDCHGDSCCC
jgi:hypothetical protein